ncbi:ATP synthase F0 subunit B [Candidatus Roizmanbacteria bacterium]|nr:ATP synthase F0 subunit B [Candidatus Roizmanbacteria bacterium]
MENLGIDAKLLIAQLINFVLFFYIFKRFIAKPFSRFLNQEKQNEKEKEALLDKLKKGEEELMLSEKKMRDKVKNERNQILENAKEDALVVREGIIAEAKKEVETMQVKAKKETLEERNKLYQEVKNKVADLSMLVLEKALKDFLDEESKKKITTYILKNLSNTVAKHENRS